MYNVGDVIMYGTFGICGIAAVEKRDLTGEEQEYYILKRLNDDKNVIYVPVNSKPALDKMRSVCSKSEINALISDMNDEELIWIEDEKKRREEYGRILKAADKHQMIRLIKTLYLRRKELSEKGKSLRASDENYLELAEKMLFEEFAYALDIGKDEVVDYIEKHIA